MGKKRPSWDEYFMEIAHIAAKRSTCLRRQVGAVLVKNNYIIATGYNGTCCGMEHCDVVGCLRDKMNIPSGERHEICRGAHAEENTIVQSALHGVSPEGGTLYTTITPCTHCAKMIINAKIKRVVCSTDYPDNLAKKLLVEAGVKLEKIKR